MGSRKINRKGVRISFHCINRILDPREMLVWRDVDEGGRLAILMGLWGNTLGHKMM